MYYNNLKQYKSVNYCKFKKNTLKRYISKTISHKSRWICLTCHNSLLKGKIPCQATFNNLKTTKIPIQLYKLCELEKQLISLIIPFMKIVQLPIGNQHGLRGQVVLVPANLQKTTDTLPRNTTESQIICLNFKRRIHTTKINQ